MLSRTNFSSSTLVRLLAQATGVGAGAPRQDVAERLSQWLNAFDAVALHGIHQSVATAAPAAQAPSAAADTAQQAVTELFQRTRAALIAAITAHGRPPVPVPKARAATLQRTPAPVPEEPAADYSVFFKRHLALQRDMALKIAPLRAQARQVLARSAPQLRPLAALDALMEQTLGGREHKLLAQVPALLEKRFEQLRDTPGAGPAVFGREWEAIVLAELNLRLQPVVGLMEAWGASPQTTQ
ncbi:MAG: DUF3348 family protein [Hydrogenophaga sp.]|nr:DUF3348 family protein [Hydrogenophaga sp.]